MDKDEFLKELQSYLSVLEEGEQADILEEYAQHIDMKISAGLSEAEAVRYFGNVRELAARILEAYHVNPGYRDLGADGGMTASEPEKSSVFNDCRTYCGLYGGYRQGNKKHGETVSGDSRRDYGNNRRSFRRPVPLAGRLDHGRKSWRRHTGRGTFAAGIGGCEAGDGQGRF